MQRLVNQIVPFILAGVAIVAFAFGIMLLAYLFLFGALVGFILFLIAWIRSRFLRPKLCPGRVKLLAASSILMTGRSCNSSHACLHNR